MYQIWSFKVTRLENENALLRQYAPAEVVAQLPYLIAANQQQKQAQQVRYINSFVFFSF